MARKMPRRLVALSASAVASIYAAGLLATQPAALSVAAAAAAPEPAVVASPTPSAVSAPVVVVGATSTTAPIVAPTAIATAVTANQSTSAYANGTYSGTGSSRFGNVSVSVTVSNGKISNVQITKVTTSFPMSRIASLPGQVVKNQTANVNVVTGATYSSQAFKQAVQTALAQALTAN
jgi:uncharacterized protein with FMN-binding domain